jgi:2-furoyl-CoA dehydrogenase large subunit
VLFDLEQPRELSLKGTVLGTLGSGSGQGLVKLQKVPDGTKVTYSYEVQVAGKVAAVGGRMLDGAARALIGQFFNGLVRQAGGAPGPGVWSVLLRLFGVRR